MHRSQSVNMETPRGEVDLVTSEEDGQITPQNSYKRPNIESKNGQKKKSLKRKLFEDWDTSDDEEEREKDNGAAYDRHEEEIDKLRERPTYDRFVYSDEILDLRCPLPGFEGASVMLTNVYNTFVHIVKFKNTLPTLQNRRLAIQLRAVEHHLRKLEDNEYVNAHIQLPRLTESLFSMWDYRTNPLYINQLKPISCVMDNRYIARNISFRTMEATSKNDSNYIEVMFNNPFRFVFVGCASRGGQHNKNVVNPFPFFGEYINKVISDMYDVLYNMVTKEIKKAKDKLITNSQNKDVSNENDNSRSSLHTMEAFSNAKQSRSSDPDTERLNSYLRNINLPLAKRENVDILITSGNSGKKSTDNAKMHYLVVERSNENNSRGTLRMVDTDVTEDALYMSSYIRCRVLMLDQPAFGMQIYTRHAIKLITMDDRLVKFSEFES